LQAGDKSHNWLSGATSDKAILQKDAVAGEIISSAGFMGLRAIGILDS
jgi:hypothetical protein